MCCTVGAQLMLDSEKAELEAHDVEQRERQRAEKRARMARKIRHQLFGPQGVFCSCFVEINRSFALV